MSRGPDAATQLDRALLATAEAAGCPVELIASDWTRWASVTFTGARHAIALQGKASAALDGWIAALPEMEFALRNHLVADLTVTGANRTADTVTVTLEALTVEER